MSSQVEKQFQTDHTEHVGTSSFQQPRVGRQDFRPPAQGCSPRPCLLRCDSGLPTALASGGRAGYQPADSSRILSTLIAIHAACSASRGSPSPHRRGGPVKAGASGCRPDQPSGAHSSLHPWASSLTDQAHKQVTSGQAFQAAHGSLARHTDQSRGARGSWEGCGEPEDEAPSAPHGPRGTALCGVQPVTGCRTKQRSPMQITAPAHPAALPSPHVAELGGHQVPHPTPLVALKE